MKKIYKMLIIVCVLLIIALTANYVYKIMYADKEVQVESKKTLTVNIDSNPTTGYYWYYSSSEGDNIIKYLNEKYTPIENDSQMVGTGGIQSFIFQSVKEGTSYLNFQYEREFEENTEPLYYVNYTITVDKDLNISVSGPTGNNVDNESPEIIINNN